MPIANEIDSSIVEQGNAQARIWMREIIDSPTKQDIMVGMLVLQIACIRVLALAAFNHHKQDGGNALKVMDGMGKQIKAEFQELIEADARGETSLIKGRSEREENGPKKT